LTAQGWSQHAISGKRRVVVMVMVMAMMKRMKMKMMMMVVLETNYHGARTW
jgi:hypothetical protein